MRLAAGLGAETAVVGGIRPVAAVLDYARRENITRLVVGKPTHPRWRDRLGGSFLDAVVRESGPIEVLVTAGDARQLSRYSMEATEVSVLDEKLVNRHRRPQNLVDPVAQLLRQVKHFGRSEHVRLLVVIQLAICPGHGDEQGEGLGARVSADR